MHARMLQTEAPLRKVYLDNVHEENESGQEQSGKEHASRLVKELKQRLLVKIIDTFQVGGRIS